MGVLATDLQARLAQLDLAIRRVLPGALRGDRRAPRRKGISLEFADFRGYVAGDDVRHLDHASYARLDQLIVRLYHDEEELHLHLFLDDSASMDEGEPNKARRARELAAALAWIGLSRGHVVHLVRLGDTALSTRPLRGPASVRALWDALEEPCTRGREPLHRILGEELERRRPRGVVVLISDLLDEAGPARILRPLAAPRAEVDVLHLLAPEELDPSFEGDLRLVDAETEGGCEVTITRSSLDAYRRELKSFLSSCEAECQRIEASYLGLNSRASLEEIVFSRLIPAGLLR